ncbi:MAG TPA: nucleotide exchange factor GrpE [Mycobacteriales bacterium]|nr:nucleotide exchange factor GrpE [Mycobacteriales bacterium]
MRDRGERPDEEEPRVVIRDKRRIDPVTGEVRHPEGDAPAGAAPGDAATWKAGQTPVSGESPEQAELRTQVAELTADVQRVSAEYANYRKRVDRDRVAVVDTATASVLSALLPVLDDLDRAREHGDLTGAFKAVADQLTAVLEKLGLAPFGEPGEPFDPTMHEAVMHSTSAEVSEPTAVQILRKGYRQGERLLRPAMVAVADPESAPESAPEPDENSEWVAPDEKPNE